MAPNSESYSKNLFFHLGSDFVVVFLFFSSFFCVFGFFLLLFFWMWENVANCSA